MYCLIQINLSQVIRINLAQGVNAVSMQLELYFEINQRLCTCIRWCNIGPLGFNSAKVSHGRFIHVIILIYIPIPHKNSRNVLDR